MKAFGCVYLAMQAVAVLRFTPLVAYLQAAHGEDRTNGERTLLHHVTHKTAAGRTPRGRRTRPLASSAL